MGVADRLRSVSGQMTVEMLVALPVLITVAVIATNALAFFSECAAFDRISCEAVRVHAAAPAYGQDVGQSISLVEQEVRSSFNEENLAVSVSHGVTGANFDEYRATLEFSPTLFGMGLRSEVLGVSLPRLKHEVRYVVDSYKPGVVV